ncbi:T-cell surface glycoprotein CD8 alpha chain isoform 1-T1 [Aulostomus maculatus]
MGQQWILVILVILVFYRRISLGAVAKSVLPEGQQVEIKCRPAEVGTSIQWFRVQDNSGMHFIVSTSNTGLRRPDSSIPSAFSDKKLKEDVLILKSFSRSVDSGVYSCASLKNNQLKFGEVTRLAGGKLCLTFSDRHTMDSSQRLFSLFKEQAKEVTKPPIIKMNPSESTTPCVCEATQDEERSNVDLVCSPLILGSLVGSCGLLLLLLIVTIMYCNHMRTRRCPHHYKRRPRTMAPGKQMMTHA